MTSNVFLVSKLEGKTRPWRYGDVYTLASGSSWRLETTDEARLYTEAAIASSRVTSTQEWSRRNAFIAVHLSCLTTRSTSIWIRCHRLHNAVDVQRFQPTPGAAAHDGPSRQLAKALACTQLQSSFQSSKATHRCGASIPLTNYWMDRPGGLTVLRMRGNNT
jgi:hypothetical protein